MPQRIVVVFSAKWAFSIFELNIDIKLQVTSALATDTAHYLPRMYHLGKVVEHH